MSKLMKFQNAFSKSLGARGPAKKILRSVMSANSAVVICLSQSLGWAGGVVTNTTEADLRAAMAGGGTVTFACDGTITVTNTMTNVVDTLLDGSGRSVTITGPGGFYVGSNSTLTVLALKMANFWGTSVGPAIINDHGTLNLGNVVFQNNTNYVSSGGAIYSVGGGLNATNCTFAYNSVIWMRNYYGESLGGAVYNNGAANFQRCDFTGNQAAGDSSRLSNLWGGGGGAICNSGTLIADSCTFVLNSAHGVNGLFLGGGGGPAYGGAIYNVGSLTVSRSLFAGNSASGGHGGVGLPGGSGGTGLNGGPGGYGGSAVGGGIYSGGGGGALVNCTFVNNAAIAGNGGPGGSGYNTPPGSGGAGGGGGGAYGGGLSGALNVVNCSVAYCSATFGNGGPGGIGGYDPIHGKAPDGPVGPNGTANDGGASGATLVNTLLASNTPGPNTFPDPKLGPLADNGGPTLTMALLPDSPAIDAGDTPAAPICDQRGFPRPAGSAADIGAFEYGSMMPVLQIVHPIPSALKILIHGNSNQWCRLLASSNLSSWTPIATNQISSDGTTSIEDNNTAASCFYRVAMP